MRRDELLRWLAIFALLTLFSTGKWALAPVAWVAPVLALYIFHRTSTRLGFFLLYVATLLALLIGWYGAVPFPPVIYLPFMMFNALVAMLPYLFDRLVTPRLGRGFATTLVFPLAATAIEYVVVGDGPLGSFGAQAYSQHALAPLTQLVSVTGLWGITFLVSWFASVAHWAVSRYEAGETFRRGILVYGLVLTAVILFGSVRLLTAPEATQEVAIASFTAEHVDMGEMMRLWTTDEAAFRERTRIQHAAYLVQSEEHARDGAQIVLWPELAGLGTTEDVEALVAAGQALADEYDLYLAMPLFIMNPSGESQPINKLVVADPEGQVALEHVKYGGNILEGTLPGSKELKTIETPFGTLSAVICWDTDYPTVLRQAGTQGVEILLSPAYVWPEVAAIHAEMATFRAIENGMTVVRQSDNGFSLISDPYGRVVARENHVGHEGTMIAAASILPTWTLYPVLGDIVGQLSVIGVALLLIGLAARRLYQVIGNRREVAREAV